MIAHNNHTGTRMMQQFLRHHGSKFLLLIIERPTSGPNSKRCGHRICE